MKWILFPLSLFVALPSLAHEVIGIADGDTLTLLVDRTPVKIRLANIDAPEKAQAFGNRSRQSLSDLCWGRDATYKPQNVDRYGRTIAVVTCGGNEVSHAQVERGMAWVYDRYNLDSALTALEEEARRNRTGLWSDDSPTPPWEFRKGQRLRQLQILKK